MNLAPRRLELVWHETGHAGRMSSHRIHGREFGTLHFEAFRYIPYGTRKSLTMKLPLIRGPRFALAGPASLLMCLFLAACSGGGNGTGGTGGGGNGGQSQSYSTSFPATENPISEDGEWINGGTTGLDWGNVQTTPGLAFGTNVSGAPPYNDSTAVLAGSWGSDQMAQATVYTVNQTDSVQEEVELRLRTTITAHSITGYEFDYRVTSDGSQYIEIVRWNGPLNDFTFLTPSPCTTCGPGLQNGDTIKATAIGSTLTLYINGVEYLQATDTTYTGGSPGIGFWNEGGTVADDSNYGFTNFMASVVQ